MARGRSLELGAQLAVRRGCHDPVEGGSSSGDAFDDLGGGPGPYEWFGVVVPVLDPPVDAVSELGHGPEAGVGERFAGQHGEPGFDQVQPRGRGRREVQVPTATVGMFEPVPNRCALVCRQVVQHYMAFEVLGHGEVDQLEERQHVGAGMTATGVVEDFVEFLASSGSAKLGGTRPFLALRCVARWQVDRDLGGHWW